MKLVVVGGQARKVGKTSVITGLIRGLSTFAWTAVKISHHDDAGWQDTPSGDDLPAHLDFLLTEEKDAQGRGDTALYLAAGARRALWLRARGGSLARALPALHEALEGDEHVIMESNSIMSFFKPVLYLLVLDESREDFKASARHFLERADAYITLRPALDPRLGPGTSPQMLGGKPVFPASVDEWSNSELCRCVAASLRRVPTEATPHPARDGW